ncbi:hypothetical protein PanWU01x14_086460 [Parasponia andersonii]|uniref:Uncharacterized protein n=1 Tax=Parasponia andersonii TaxID=3476 RepID=A0A2P5D9C1_PARAD|nr:hypothetical protein PanWU01x14_086460 [Parasponia andersonii]
MALPQLRSFLPKTIAIVRAPICKPYYYLSTATTLRRDDNESKSPPINNGDGQRTNGNKGLISDQGISSITDQKSTKNRIERIAASPKKTPEAASN